MSKIQASDLLDTKRYPGQAGNALRLAAATELLHGAAIPFMIEATTEAVPYASGVRVEVGFNIRVEDRRVQTLQNRGNMNRRYTPEEILRSFPGEVTDPATF
jgi:hypothetical protein